MSTPLRIVDLYIVGNQETDDAGRPKAQPTRLNRCEQVLLRVHLLNADGTEYTQLPASPAFSYGLDNIFTAGHADLVTSDNAKFLADDWTGTDGWNLAKGRFCVRINLHTSELASALGAKVELLTRHAIWITPLGEDPFLAFHLLVYVDNVTVEPGGSAAANEHEEYVTVAAGAALFVPQHGDLARCRWNGTNFEFYFDGDEKWRELIPTLVDGNPVIGWGDPKD